MKTLICTVFALFPLLSAPAAEPANRLYELRTYHAEPGKLDALLTRFRDHTVKLFSKHGMTHVGYWVPVENPDNLLVYLLAYPDKPAREAAWKGFLADADWQAAQQASEANGKLVGRVDSLLLEPADFSPGFDAHDGAPRLFEMRTYTTPPDGVAALDARFREHTLGLFRKHGMTNLGYFHPVEGAPGAGRTLLYFLAHKDQAAATGSWDGFRTDPAWVEAKAASEKAAGGSLTVENGVQNRFLRAVDFSPVK